MDTERWERLKEILNEVGELPADQRQAYLHQACRSDASMLREAQSLLDFDDDGLDGFIEEPLWRVPPRESADKNVGRRVGAYRIRRLLGRGGMGAVYLAVRQDDFEHRVALKLVNPGMYTGEILDRFLNERQILAHLQHPNIARLLDGGSTDDELPYFVMEYVEGEPIDAYCKARKLSVTARLRLFRQVCAAVHVAHQNLVVHRDIKPSNILITPEGVPKLLDFGIAKILRTELASRGLQTAAGQLPMTPDYASPEQILDEVITTASDVYSLGVLLYELLSGRPPYQLDGLPYQEKVRVVCESERIRPSTHVGQTIRPAAKGDTLPPRREVRRLRRRLAGDLDAIVLKAMRSEPRHRYRSVEQLSDDIRRHLEGEPVLARQGTWTYLASRYVRRHKLGLAVMLMVLGFAASTTLLWREAVEGREQAQQATRRLDHVVAVLVDLFLASNPDETGGKELTARDILERGHELAESLGEDVETQAYLLRVMGLVYTNLGVCDTAREVKQKVLELQRQISSPDDPELATDIANLAKVEYDCGDLEVAERLYGEALRIRQSNDQDPVAIATTMDNLSNTLSRQGRYAKAETIKNQVLEIRVRALGESDLDVAWTRYGLGVISYALGELEKAEDILRRALDAYVEKGGAVPSRTASIRSYLGVVLREMGRYEEAERALEDSLEVRRTLFGEDDRRVAVAKTRLAALHLSRGELAAAEELLNPALSVLQKRSEDFWPRVEAEGVFGAYLVKSGRYAEAEPYLRRGYELTRAAKGADSTYTRIALRRLRQLEEAEARR